MLSVISIIQAVEQLQPPRFRSDDAVTEIVRRVKFVCPSIAELEKTTKLPRHEIRGIYRRLKQDFPSGALTEKDFTAAMNSVFLNGDAKEYCQILFRKLDDDKDGLVSFKDLLNWIGLVRRGMTGELADWLFDLYDLDADGILTANEMRTLIISVDRLHGYRGASSVASLSTDSGDTRIYQSNQSLANTVINNSKADQTFEETAAIAESDASNQMMGAEELQHQERTAYARAVSLIQGMDPNQNGCVSRQAFRESILTLFNANNDCHAADNNENDSTDNSVTITGLPATTENDHDSTNDEDPTIISTTAASMDDDIIQGDGDSSQILLDSKADDCCTLDDSASLVLDTNH